MTPIYKKGNKGDSGNYRTICLTFGPGEIMKQITLSEITQLVQDNWRIRPSKHGFMKGWSSSTSLIVYYRVTCLVDEGKAVDVIYLVFRKTFDTVSHSILLEEAGSP